MTRPRLFILIAAALLGVALLAVAGFAEPLRERMRAVLLPVTRVFATVGAGMGRALRLDDTTEAANERADEAEARLQAITVDYVRLRALEEENRSLRAQAEFIVERALQTVGARVISRSLEQGNAVVTIDRGARDGVEVGQAVVTDEGLFVGKVLTLGERTATVLLASDIRSRVAASVSGVARLGGVVEGQGSGTARFTLVPQSFPLDRDNVVVTSGTEDKIPPNVVIGLVNDVETRATDPFKSAALELLAPLDRLELVSIILTTR